jgi:hypothetical protein
MVEAWRECPLAPQRGVISRRTKQTIAESHRRNSPNPRNQTKNQMNELAKLQLRQAEADARQALAKVRAQLEKAKIDPKLIDAVENHITRDRAPAKPSARPAPAPAKTATATTATTPPRPTATAPAPAPAQGGFVTAAQFAGPPPPRMLKSEFNKLTDANRSRFIREGGRLVADPKAPRR